MVRACMTRMAMSCAPALGERGGVSGPERAPDASLLLDSITDHAIFALDPAGCITTWSRGAERLLGYGRDEIVGQHVGRRLLVLQVDLKQLTRAQALGRPVAQAHAGNALDVLLERRHVVGAGQGVAYLTLGEDGLLVRAQLHEHAHHRVLHGEGAAVDGDPVRRYLQWQPVGEALGRFGRLILAHRCPK